jgi:hypothetical protein
LLYHLQMERILRCTLQITAGHCACVNVCVVKFVTRCSYVENARHITLDDITYRFIAKI